jgi:uncharacterized protein YukJ
MTITYGFVKCKVSSILPIVPKHIPDQNETQYHLHAKLLVAAPNGGTAQWDTAVNVGTDDAGDLLRYKLVPNYRNDLTDALAAAQAGPTELTGTQAPPALDFLRTGVLKGTGAWKVSAVMNGSEALEPFASLKALLAQAREQGADVYVFGRFYEEGGGLHDIHMNQGSKGKFLNHGKDHDAHGKLIDHNDAWQDGAVLVDLGDAGWTAYFTAFTKQFVPTDDRGNPVAGGHQIEAADEGSLAGQQSGG